MQLIAYYSRIHILMLSISIERHFRRLEAPLQIATVTDGAWAIDGAWDVGHWTLPLGTCGGIGEKPIEAYHAGRVRHDKNGPVRDGVESG